MLGRFWRWQWGERVRAGETLGVVAVLTGDVDGSWAAAAGSTTLDPTYLNLLASLHPDRVQIAQFGG